MRNIISLCLLVLFFISGSSIQLKAQQSKNTQDKKSKKTITYGKKFSIKEAIPFTTIPDKLESKDSVVMVAEGTIKEICQVKGCWAKVDMGNGKEMMIRFKDYAFFLPKDASGRKVILHGKAFKQITSVADQRHYAEDAGKPKEEIEKIKDPKESLHFEADGVILY